MTKVSVATFNTEWRQPGSEDAKLIRERLGETDIICLTEAYRDFFGDTGHVLAAPFVGPGQDTDRSKVLLWSKLPWREVDEGGGALLGYYLGATTDTESGPVRVHGMVIPYRFSGVRYGQPERKIWELHQAYLRALDSKLVAEPEREIALGDFNQRVPRKYQPQYILDELERVVLRRFQLASGGTIPGIEQQSIDHICHSHDLSVRQLEGLSNIAPDGRQISDHFGLKAQLTG